MSKVTVDGRSYPMPDEFTFREMAQIKLHTGLRAGEMYEGLAKGDSDVGLALAAIAKARAGEGDCWETLLDMSVTKIEIDFTDEEADAGPPAEAAEAAEREEDAA